MAIDARKQHILTVDDDTEYGLLLQHQLQQVGYRVTYMNRGETAINFVRSTLNGARPDRVDAVILDIFMPGTSGPDVVQALRNVGYTGVVVGLSSVDEETGTLVTERFEFDTFREKPLDVDELGGIIANASTQKATNLLRLNIS